MISGYIVWCAFEITLIIEFSKKMSQKNICLVVVL